jgi:hypothetical protein
MEFGISEAIFHRCRSQDGVVSSSEAKHLRELERECSPRKGHRRTNPGPRPPQRDEPNKLLRPPRKRQSVSYIPANIGLSPSAGRAGSSLSPGRLSVTRAASRKETYRCWSGWSISQENPRYGYRSVWAFLRGRPLRLTRSGCTSCEEKKD